MFLLPYDLIRVILEDYLERDVRTLARLDTAACNHEIRAEILAVLASTKMASPCSLPFPFVDFLHWIAVKRIQITEIQVTAVDLDEFSDLLALDDNMPNRLYTPLPTVTGLALSGSTKTGFHPFALFLAYFPNLTAVDCSQWTSISDKQLKALGPLKLQALDLSNCLLLTASAVAWVACSAGNALQELSCDVLDDSAVAHLAKHCRQLRILRMSCAGCKSSAGLKKLCAANASTLQELAINHRAGFGAVLSTVKSIVAKSSCLKTLRLFTGVLNFALTAPGWNEIGSIVQCGVSLELFEFGNTTLQLYKLDDGRKACDLRAGDACVSDICRIKTALRMPVRNWDSMDGPAYGSAALQQLADFHGGASTVLMTLQIKLENDAAHSAAVSHLIRSCSSLTTLAVRTSDAAGGAPGIAPTAFHHLAAHCPLLTSLDFSCTRIFTDITLISFLVSLKALRIKKLSVSHCSQLTNTSLVTIAAFCNHLEALDIMETACQPDCMATLFASDVLRAKTIRCSQPAAVLQLLKNAGCWPPLAEITNQRLL